MVAVIYNDLPWRAIRHEWESTSISLAALARKHGIRSATTLERKRVAEQWSRAPTIEGHMAPFTAEDQLAARGEPACLPDRGAADPRLTPEAIGAEVLMTGLLALQRLQAVLQPPGDRKSSGNDEAADQATLGNLQCLIRGNPDRETLAGLMTAAGKLIDLGITIQRRAMADAASQPATSDASVGFVDRDMTAIISRMTPEMRGATREIMMEMQQERRTAQIAVAGTIK